MAQPLEPESVSVIQLTFQLEVDLYEALVTRAALHGLPLGDYLLRSLRFCLQVDEGGDHSDN